MMKHRILFLAGAALLASSAIVMAAAPMSAPRLMTSAMTSNVTRLASRGAGACRFSDAARPQPVTVRDAH